MRLTGAERLGRAADGDAILDGHPVEVKRATSKTLNQVRAVKYLPIAVYFEPRGEWYVVPAHSVVVAVSQRVRGQHTENPFESATLNLRSLEEFKIPRPDRLRDATLEAVRASAHHPELLAEMQSVLRESRALADATLDRVRALIRKLGLVGE